MKKILLFLSFIGLITIKQIKAACETECKAYCDKECPADYWVCISRPTHGRGSGDIKPERYEKEPQCPQGYKAERMSCKDYCYRTCNQQCTNPCSEGCSYNPASKSCVGACSNRNVGTPPQHFNPNSIGSPTNRVNFYKSDSKQVNINTPCVKECREFCEKECPAGHWHSSCKKECESFCNSQCYTPTCQKGCGYHKGTSRCIGACKDKTVGPTPEHFDPNQFYSNGATKSKMDKWKRFAR